MAVWRCEILIFLFPSSNIPCGISRRTSEGLIVRVSLAAQYTALTFIFVHIYIYINSLINLLYILLIYMLVLSIVAALSCVFGLRCNLRSSDHVLVTLPSFRGSISVLHIRA